MLSTQFLFVLAVGIVFGQTDAQCIGRIRTVVPAVPAYQPAPCYNSYKNEDLGVALILAQLLNEKDSRGTICSSQPSNSPAYASGNLNVEDIIMKLVNALIYTTTQSGKTSSSSSSGGSGGGGSNLIDLDLLGKNGNLLGLGLGGQGVLGVGVGQ